MKNASTLSWIWGQVYSIAQIDQLLMKGIREISQNSAWPSFKQQAASFKQQAQNEHKQVDRTMDLGYYGTSTERT